MLFIVGAATVIVHDEDSSLYSLLIWDGVDHEAQQDYRGRLAPTGRVGSGTGAAFLANAVLFDPVLARIAPSRPG